ncbi:hypothetical protein COCMIDRAFT_111252, partial [Bipolaris oryzae ATCC 44560]
EGHKAVVKLLLDKGAKTNTEGGILDNALYAALAQVYKAVVRLLRDKLVM